MRIRRLDWCGLEIHAGGETLLLDYVLDTSQLPLRNEKHVFLASTTSHTAIAGVVTHLHPDHADPVALDGAIRKGAPVFRPEPAVGPGPDLQLTAYAEAAFTKVPLDVHIVDPWTSHEVGPFKLHAVPAVDGFGDPQLSWIVESEGRRIIHGGDTLFHGYWGRIARRYGPIDQAFLPINGAVVDFPFLQPARAREAVMSPEEAAQAAYMLGAAVVTPIHYGALHRAPVYIETENAVSRLLAAGRKIGLAVEVREPGEQFEVG